MTVKTIVVNTSAVFIAIFLFAASINAQPMMSPKSAFAQNLTSSGTNATQTGSSEVAASCPSGTTLVRTGFGGCVTPSVCPTGSSVVKRLCQPAGTTPECPSSAPNLGSVAGRWCFTSSCPSGTIFNPQTEKCNVSSSNSTGEFTIQPTG